MRKPAGSAYQDLVAFVAKAFDPGADVKTGEWVEGPDGRLDMDVSIRGNVDGKPVLVVIECKDFDLSKTGKVGRPFIDALDSKRHDLGADAVFISSNSGFTEDALNKARRKGIGAISVLSSGDQRVKIILEKEIYFRKVKLGPLTFTYNGPGASSLKAIGVYELKYRGAPVDAWLQIRASAIVAANPDISQKFTATFNFKKPTEFDFKGQNILLQSIAISLSPETYWYAQKVQLDASVGMYDYLRGRVRLAGGENKYLINGVNFDTGTQLDAAPKIETVGENLLSGEIDIGLVMVEGVTMDRETPMPLLEEVIIPEDLNIKM
ncbi:MAG TPA: restriction endonuclease [Candidatus Paceibacterota bacterium]|nr:restriction endonuclease [Candidatus Paceibacterota bacterium]